MSTTAHSARKKATVAELVLATYQNEQLDRERIDRLELRVKSLEDKLAAAQRVSQ